jgi:hypothetical protein
MYTVQHPSHFLKKLHTEKKQFDEISKGKKRKEK